VTFIINYLYMTLRGNQLLQIDQSGTYLIAELFLSALDSYVSIMSEWVTKGELNEESKEFFIKPNPKVFKGQGDSNKVSSKNQWSESFIYRTINLRELMASEGMYVPSDDKNDQPKLEVSVPIFLRPVMMEILSIGKSIKILRYLETHRKTLAGTGFEEYTNFTKLYEGKKDKELSNFFRTPTYLDPKLHSMAQKHLESAVWDSSYR
jgi:hypothetical protein